MRHWVLLLCAAMSGCYLSHECMPGEYGCVRELTVQPAGLYTNPNVLSEVPDGALEVASNVVFRRPGILEPRPGVIAFFTPSASDTDVWKLLGYFGGRTYYGADYTGGSPEKRIYGTNTEILDQSGNSIQFTQFLLRSAVAQGDMFLTTDSGVLRHSSSTAVAYRSGMPPGMTPLRADATGSAYSASDRVFFRTLFVRYSGTRLIRGAPSGRVFYESAAGGACLLTVPLPAEVIAGDRLQVYRSRIVTTVPSDELFLLVDIVVTSAHVAAGVITYTDDSENEGLSSGIPLYTNETSGGLIRANDRPPAAKDLALYGERLWAANTSQPHTVNADAVRWGDPLGLWRENFTGSYTSGSPTVSSVGSINWASLRVGQYITDRGDENPESAGTNVPANTTILSWNEGAQTITMSANALATNAAVASTMGDIVTIDATKYYAANTNNTTTRQFDTDPSGNGAPLASFAYVVARSHATIFVGVDYSGATGSPSSGRMFFQRRNLGTSSFTVTTTAPQSFGGANVTSSGVLTSSAETAAARLHWSKSFESDAFPLVAYKDIGDTTKAVLRILPTRDSLFVLKEDGVWRVSNVGDDIQDVRIDPFDTTLQLIHRNAACVMNNRVWAWTTRGIVAFNESGVIGPIDMPIDNITSTHMRTVFHGGTATYLYLAADELNNELIVGLPDGSAVYVFNVDQSAWSSWTLGVSGVFTGATRDALSYINPSNDSGHLFFATDDAVLAAHEDPTPGSVPLYWDGLYSRTITTAADNVINVSAAVTTATRGSLVVQGVNRTYLTADVAAATALPVEDSTGFSAGAVTIYSGFVSTWKFTDRFAGDPGVEKHYREVAMLYEGTGIPVQYIAYGSWGETAAEEADANSDPDTTQVLGIGREAARGTRLGVLVGGTQVDTAWSLLGATFTFEQGGRAR